MCQTYNEWRILSSIVVFVFLKKIEKVVTVVGLPAKPADGVRVADCRTTLSCARWRYRVCTNGHTARRARVIQYRFNRSSTEYCYYSRTRYASCALRFFCLLLWYSPIARVVFPWSAVVYFQYSCSHVVTPFCTALSSLRLCLTC